MIECIICYNEKNTDYYFCNHCHRNICMTCYNILYKCPFCRISYNKILEQNNNIWDWNKSKILRKKCVVNIKDWNTKIYK